MESDDRIRLFYSFRNNRICVVVKRHQKLRKSMQRACEQLQCPQENCQFYHNEQQLSETDTPDSVNLINKSTISMIKCEDDENQSNETDETNEINESNVEADTNQSQLNVNLNTSDKVMDLNEATETEATHTVDVAMHENDNSNDSMETVESPMSLRREPAGKERQYAAKRNATLLSTMDSLLQMSKDSFAKEYMRFEKEMWQIKHAEENVALKSALQVANAKCEQLKFDHRKEMQSMAEKHAQSLKKLTVELENSKKKSPKKGAQKDQPKTAEQKATSNAEASQQTTPQKEQSSASNDEISQLKRSLSDLQEKYDQLNKKLDEEQGRHRNDLKRYHDDWQQTNMDLRMQSNSIERQLKEYKVTVNAQHTEIKDLRNQLQAKNTYAEALRVSLSAQNETIDRLQQNSLQQMAQLTAQSTLYSTKLTAMQHQYMSQLQKIASGMNSDKFAFGENSLLLSGGPFLQPKKEENNLDRKPLTPLSEVIEDPNAQERKCNNCGGKAKFKMVIAYCNSDCIKNYCKKKSEQ